METDKASRYSPLDGGDKNSLVSNRSSIIMTLESYSLILRTDREKDGLIVNQNRFVIADHAQDDLKLYLKSSLG